MSLIIIILNKKKMKKILLLGLFLTLNNVLSQNYIEQVLILNEGYFDYYDTQEIIEPVTIGSYDIETNNYTEIATIEGARFASDLIIDDNNFFIFFKPYSSLICVLALFSRSG